MSNLTSGNGNDPDFLHQDAQAALDVEKKSNPYSLTNIILSVGLLFGAWLAEQVWSGLKENLQSNEAGLQAIQAVVSDTKVTLISHSYMLQNLQSDVTSLKASAITKSDVDDRIRALMPHQSSLVSPHQKPDALTLGATNGMDATDPQ